MQASAYLFYFHLISSDEKTHFSDNYFDLLAGPDLVEAVQEVSVKGGYQLGGEHYKRVPRGYDLDHPNADLLRYNGLTAGSEMPIPEELYSEARFEYSYKKYIDMYSIQHRLFDLPQGLASN